ncbi:MAG: hypothetical protein ACR2MW_09305 [Chthoniobacterales bacterium]
MKCLALGLAVTLAQVALAVGTAHPEGSWGDRYRTLVQHDSFWFANIIDRGYGTTLPPVDHKEMEVSNVAFFPAYPLLASALARVTGLGTYEALLVAAQLATWAFWTYFFLFAVRWELSPVLQGFGALAIVAHPAAFYLVAGYSESLFLAMLAGFLSWSTREGRGAAALAVGHGVVLSATRIVGLPCALFPIVHSVFGKGWARTGNFRAWLWRQRGPVLVSAFSMLGGLAFFLYCQVRWGRWDIYMLTQSAGWGIEPDYLAAFRPENYRWALPPYDAPTVVSQFTSAVAGGLFVAIAAAELLRAFRGESGWRRRLGFYFCAALIYYLSLAGVASVQLESMLRYDLCVHALVVLGLLHFLGELRVAPVFVRAFAMAAVAVAAAAGLALQGYYVWNFTQGNWVA